MARIKFKDFVPRPKPKKRPRRHAKSVSKRIPLHVGKNEVNSAYLKTKKDKLGHLD